MGRLTQVSPSGAGVSRARFSQTRRPEDCWRRPNSRRPLSPPLPFDGQPDLTCDAWPQIGRESLHPWNRQLRLPELETIARRDEPDFG